ncbi:hypothetical protein YC2023_042481 [Brassica napus]
MFRNNNNEKKKGFMITDPVKIENIVMNVVSLNPQSSLSSNEVGKQSLKAFAGQGVTGNHRRTLEMNRKKMNRNKISGMIRNEGSLSIGNKRNE